MNEGELFESEGFGVLCEYCGGPRSMRNPKGYCDHLYWPDNLSRPARLANGIDPIPPAPEPKGCICPPTSELTCQRWDCGRKGMLIGGSS